MGLAIKAENIVFGVAALAVVGAVLYLVIRGPGQAAQDVTRAAVNVAGGAATGVVHGVADFLGVPTPDADTCAADRAAGNTWSVIFSSCDIKNSIDYLWNE